MTSAAGKLSNMFMLSAEMGARTSLYCALEPGLSQPEYSGMEINKSSSSLKINTVIIGSNPTKIENCSKKCMFSIFFVLVICISILKDYILANLLTSE